VKVCEPVGHGVLPRKAMPRGEPVRSWVERAIMSLPMHKLTAMPVPYIQVEEEVR
jgi:hypothetical protein